MSASASAAIFLSYASQDAAAARRICDALRAAGLEVWFDQNELVGGDAWDRKIRGQIRDCALFLPLISANTQARLEGYFRLEWKLAEDRSHLMAKGKPFLVPVVIDATSERDAHVPDAFLAVQWTRVPDGETPAAFVVHVQRLLGNSVPEPTPSRPARPGEITASPPAPPVGRALRARRFGPGAVAAAVAALAIAGYFLITRKASAPADPAARQNTVPTPEKSTAPLAPNPSPAAPQAAADKSLVVLPLENLSPDPENAFFTEGMHDEITSALGRLTDLKVISRNSALAFRDSKLPLAEIARQLGVANVITGSVRRAGNTVRIRIELRRASDEAVLWALPGGDRELKDTLGLQSEIAGHVARVLQARGDKGIYAGARFLSTNTRAFDLYLKAFNLYSTSSSNAAEIEKCMAMMEEALALDPAFMPAARLAGRMATRLFIIADEPAEQARAAAAAKKWSELASLLMPGGAGDGALAFYLAIVEQDATRALATAENAIRALPNDVEGYHVSGLALRNLGRPEEAANRWAQAEAIDAGGVPSWGNHIAMLRNLRRKQACEEVIAQYLRVRSSVAMRLANETAIADARFALDGVLPDAPETIANSTVRAEWLWRLRRFEPLLALSEDRLATNPRGVTRFTWLRHKIDALLRLNRREEAQVAAREALAVAQTLQSMRPYGSNLPEMVSALARLGRADDSVAEARAYIEARPAANLGRRWTQEVELAELLAFLNRKTECIELLAKLLRVPSGLTVPMLKVDPTWDPVRDDPGFQALLADPKNSAPL